MAFTVQDFHDLIRLLEERPDWRVELQRVVLTERLLGLPDVVRELAAAQARTEAQMEQLAARMDELTAAQVRTEARVEELAVAQRELAAAQARTEARVEELAAAQARTEARLEQLTARVDELTARLEQLAARVDELTVRLEQLTARVDELTVRLEQLTARVDELTVRLEQLAARVDQLTARVDRVEAQIASLVERMDEFLDTMERVESRLGDVEGKLLEMTFERRAATYLSGLALKVRVVPHHEFVAKAQDAVEEGRLTQAEADSIARLDLLARGLRRKDRSETYLAVEISRTIRVKDVTCAKKRAQFLEKLYPRVSAVVAGAGIGPDASTMATELGVQVVLDGQVLEAEE